MNGEPIPQLYHDVQIMVSGPATAALGDLARERWFRATGRRLETPRAHGIQNSSDPWPAHIQPEIENVELGISRTEPEYGKQAEVREVEQLLLDSIASACESIYIEAQYFSARKVGEHLGMEPARIEKALAREGSLIRGAIESLRGPGRSMRPLALQVTVDMDALVPDEEIIDPARPFETNELVKEPTRRHLYMVGSILAAIVALAAAWHWSPLRELVDVPLLVSAANELGRHRAAPLLVLGIFVVASLISFPLSVPIIVCALVFGPWQGFLYTLAGALLSATCSYALGHLLGRRAVRRVAGRKLRELDKRLARRGLLTIIIVRIVPLAPFSVINLVAGTSRIRFRDFMLGSTIGLLPGLIVISVFTDQLAATLRKSDLPTFAILAAALASLIVGALRFWQWKEKKRDSALRTPFD